jgi:hypothetical protein
MDNAAKTVIIFYAATFIVWVLTMFSILNIVSRIHRKIDLLIETVIEAKR